LSEVLRNSYKDVLTVLSSLPGPSLYPRKLLYSIIILLSWGRGGTPYNGLPYMGMLHPKEVLFSGRRYEKSVPFQGNVLYVKGVPFKGKVCERVSIFQYLVCERVPIFQYLVCERVPIFQYLVCERVPIFQY